MSLNSQNTPANSLGRDSGRLPALAWRKPARSFRFQSVGTLFAGFMGGEAKSYAPSPVWRDSTTKNVKYQAMPKRKAVKLWHDARRFERQTREPGKQDGALGRNGLAVLQALLFDFMNYASGALYPSKREIARMANISERSAARGLEKLKASGVVSWLRRCVEEWIDGRFSLRQLSNAYAVLPPTQWRGFKAPPPAPTPCPGTWGDHPPLADALTLACQEAAAGAGIKGQCAVLESEDNNPLAVALARLGRLMAKGHS